MTESLALLELLEQLILYVVVLFKLPVRKDPDKVLLLEAQPLVPPLELHEVAFVELQRMVVLSPKAILVSSAVIWTVGCTG